MITTVIDGPIRRARFSIGGQGIFDCFGVSWQLNLP